MEQENPESEDSDSCIDTATSIGINPGIGVTLTGDNDPAPKLLSPSCPKVPTPQHLVALSMMAHPCVSPISIVVTGPDPPSNEVPV